MVFQNFIKNSGHCREENNRRCLGAIIQSAVGERDQQDVIEKMNVDKVVFPVGVLKPWKGFEQSLLSYDRSDFDVIISIKSGNVGRGELEVIKPGECGDKGAAYGDE